MKLNRDQNKIKQTSINFLFLLTIVNFFQLPSVSRLTTHGTEENCLLSDVSIRDLRPGLDYIYDNNHVLFAWKDLDPYCVITGYSVDDDHVFGGPSPSRPLLPGLSRPDFSLGGTDYSGVRPESTYPDSRPFFTIPKPGGHNHGVRPFSPDKPDPVGSYRPDGGYGGHDDKFGYGNRPGNRPGFDHGSYRKWNKLVCFGSHLFQYLCSIFFTFTTKTKTRIFFWIF